MSSRGRRGMQSAQNVFNPSTSLDPYHDNSKRAFQSVQFPQSSFQMQSALYQKRQTHFPSEDVRLKSQGDIKRKKPQYYNRNNSNKGKEKFDKSKIYANCPECKRYFDLSAKTPLLLHCMHTICEECLNGNVTPRGVSLCCKVCNQETTLKMRVRSDFSLRDYFSINFHMAGKIYYKVYRRNDNETGIPFEPVTYENSATNASLLQQVDTTGKQKCKDCQVVATLQCLDCCNIFCTKCSETVHKCLKMHRIISICIMICPFHPGYPQDFHCFDCNGTFCTYCIINEHNNHKYKQITKLDPTEGKKFRELLTNCKQTLQKLRITQETLVTKILQTKPKQINQILERSISTCFYNLHAKLQYIEDDLIRQATTIPNQYLKSLRKMEQEVNNNIGVVMDLIKQGEDIINDVNVHTKQNMHMFMQQMLNVAILPQTFDIKDLTNSGNTSDLSFEFTEFQDDWISHFKLRQNKRKIVSDIEAIERTLNIIDSESDTSSIITIDEDTKKSLSEYSAKTESMLKRHNIDAYCEPDQTYLKLDLTKSMSMHEFPSINVPKVNLNKSSREMVIVTYIVSPLQFYVQLTKHYNAIQMFHKQLEYYVEKGYVTSVQTPDIGKLYLAKYSEANCTSWRRVIIKKIFEGERECCVSHIDYGNSSMIPFNDLRSLFDDAAAIPPFAFECKLHNVRSVQDREWTDSDVGLMADMLSCGNVTMIIKKALPSYNEVDLKIYSKNGDFSLCDSFLFMGCVLREISEELDNSLEIMSSSTSDSTDSGFYPETLKKEEKFVKLVSIINAVTVYIQYSSSNDYFHKLQESLSDYYSKPINLTENMVYAPKVGNKVAVREMGIVGIPILWNRGIVLEVHQGSGTVRVQLVDLGIEKTVSYANIRALPKIYTSHVTMAIKVRLAHVNYINEGQNVIGKAFLDTIKEKMLMMVVHLEAVIPEINLFQSYPDFDVSINTQLVQLGLQSTGFMTLTLEWPHDESPVSEESTESFTSNLVHQTQGGVLSDFEDCEEDTSHLNFEPVKVVHIETPECLYIHFHEDQKYTSILAQIDRMIQDYYSKHNFIPNKNWTVGNCCISYDTKTKRYYRVKILKCLSDNQYEVISEDFCNTFISAAVSMSEIEEKFLKVPPLALKVRLYGVTPAGGKWSLMIVEYLKDLLIGKTNIYCTKVQAAKEETVPVIMWIRKAMPVAALERTKIISVLVNKLLFKTGLAFLIKNWNLPEKLCEAPEEMSDFNLTDNDSKIAASLVSTYSGLNMQWLPAEEEDQTTFNAIATYVNEFGYVYYHHIEEINLLTEIENDIFEKFQCAELESDVKWEVGDICTVRFHQNKKWYRGEVIGFNSATNEIRVCMIDYGNVEDVDFTELSKNVMFLDVPRIAKKVKLHNLRFKGNISTTVLDILHVLIVTKVIEVDIVENASDEQPPSAYIRQGNIPVNTFIQTELIKFQKNKKIQSKLGYNSIALSESLINDTPLGYSYIKLPTSEFFEVTIINVVDINKIVFELGNHEEYGSDFEILQREINENYSKQSNLQLDHDGQPCIARYDEDNIWYRGKSIRQNGKLLVHFVDFGNIEEVKDVDIRTIKPKWLKYPVEQFLAILSGFKLVMENHVLLINAVKQHLGEYLHTSKLASITQEDPLSIKLFDVHSKELAYKELILTSVIQEVV